MIYMMDMNKLCITNKKKLDDVYQFIIEKYSADHNKLQRAMMLVNIMCMLPDSEEIERQIADEFPELAGLLGGAA